MNQVNVVNYAQNIKQVVLQNTDLCSPKIYIDFCKLTKTINGNSLFVRGSRDSFSEFVWAIPTTDQKRETVLKLLQDYIFAQHFSFPSLRNFLFNFGIMYELRTAYRSQGNTAERYVANLTNAIRVNCSVNYDP